MSMDHIPGGEFAKAVVELHPLAQIKRPFFQIRARFPLFRQAGCELPSLGVNVEERLQKGVVLQMLGAGNGPEAVALGEPGGAKDDALSLGFLGQRRCWRGHQGCGQCHQEHQHRENKHGQPGLYQCGMFHEAPRWILVASCTEGV